MPPSPSRIHWKGLPRYCLPRIRIRVISNQSTIHDKSHLAAQNVFRTPLGEAFKRTRELQQMRARRQRIARSQATFPNLAIYRKSVRGAKRVVTTSSGRQVIFPRHHLEGRRSSSQSRRRRPSRQSGQSQRLRQVRHARRLTAQQKLTVSRASLRRAVSSTRGQPRRSTSSKSIGSSPRPSTSSRSSGAVIGSSISSSLTREPSYRSAAGTRGGPQIQIHKSTPRPRLVSPAPYLGAIPSPLPGARRTPLEKQTFVSRRVGGRYVHEPIPLKPSGSDLLHRGLSNSSNYSRKSRIYDKRLSTRKGPAESVNGFIILPDAKPDLPLLFASSLDFAKLDGSSAGRSSSGSSTPRGYPGEESASNIVNVDIASRTTSEARALDDFTQGLQQHLRATFAEGVRPRSPSVAQTVVSTHTLQELVAFRDEFKAAGLAVTSRDQRGARSQRQSEKTTPPQTKVKAEHSRAAAARRPSIVAASTTAPPQMTYSTLNVPSGVEVSSPRSISPLVPGRNPALIAVRSKSPAGQSKIPVPKDKFSSKKPLPWLKNPGQVPPSKEALSAFRAPNPPDSPFRTTNNSSVTTIIDFTPHPSEFWNKQGMDFDDFQSRHPNLNMDRSDSPNFDMGGIIMLENELKQPVALDLPQRERSPSQVMIHDKSGPPKPVRLDISERPHFVHGGGGHRAPSPLQTQLFPEDIDADPDASNGLVRADSFDRNKDSSSLARTLGLPSIPDFSSFTESTVSDRRRRSSATRPKSEGDQSDIPLPVGRRASKEEMWAEKRRRSKEDLLRPKRGLGKYDEQRTKFEIKKVTPWELGGESADSGDGRRRKAKTSEDHYPQIEIISGTKSETSTPRSEKPDGLDGAEKDRKGLFGGKLSLRRKMRGIFSPDRDSRSSAEDEIPPTYQSLPILPSETQSERPKPGLKAREREKDPIPEQTIVVPDCEECQNPSSAQFSSGRYSSINEPKSARSFQEWQAGVPFKPLSRESSINEPEELLPCGHRKKNLEGRAGDPVKRIVAARRTKPPSIRGSRAPSIFTIQESVPRAAPKIAPPTTQTVTKSTDLPKEPSSSEEVTDKEILKGLGIVLEGVINSDVEAWIQEATGTNVRKFLGDLAAMDKLGTGPLANSARRNASKRGKAVERITARAGGHRKGRSEGSVL